ncbi:MAG: cyclic nucleotide-binding domain-containing protein [Fibrobacterota bacterium]
MAQKSFDYIRNMILLRRCSIFSVLTPSQLRRIAATLTRFTCDTGGRIVAQGDQLSELFIVVHGAVELVRSGGGREVLSADDAEDTFIGEMSLFRESYESPFSVTALEESEFITLSREKMYRIMGENPSISIRILEILARRLDDCQRSGKK